jgi:hypothetical protein
MKLLITLALTTLLPTRFMAPETYDKTLVEISTLTFENDQFGIVKLKRNGNHVKVKYFAYRDNNGTMVGTRYQNWAANKNIIGYSSGTYMDACNAAIAKPVGLCIDQGRPVNNNLQLQGLDGLIIVYATGGIVASNLKEANLTVTYADGRKKTLNIRDNSYDMEEFKSWAQENEATVFQTHLFVHKDKMLVTQYAKTTEQERRFLAVCKLDNGDVVHYIINLPQATTILKGAQKAFKFLKAHEEVNEVAFMINLDTGCQDVFKLYDASGKENNGRNFQGGHRIDLSNASNVLAYYYE